LFVYLVREAFPYAIWRRHTSPAEEMGNEGGEQFNRRRKRESIAAWGSIKRARKMARWREERGECF